MTTIIVLFNLKPDADASAYEAWAKSTDLPTVNALSSIDKFSVLKSEGLLMSDATPPYAYIEILQVADMQAFGGDIQTETMAKVAAEFQAFADNPLFILTSNLSD